MRHLKPFTPKSGRAIYRRFAMGYHEMMLLPSNPGSASCTVPVVGIMMLIRACMGAGIAPSFRSVPATIRYLPSNWQGRSHACLSTVIPKALANYYKCAWVKGEDGPIQRHFPFYSRAQPRDKTPPSASERRGSNLKIRGLSP